MMQQHCREKYQECLKPNRSPSVLLRAGAVAVAAGLAAGLSSGFAVTQSTQPTHSNGFPVFGFLLSTTTVRGLPCFLHSVGIVAAVATVAKQCRAGRPAELLARVVGVHDHLWREFPNPAKPFIGGG